MELNEQQKEWLTELLRHELEQETLSNFNQKMIIDLLDKLKWL